MEPSKGEFTHRWVLSSGNGRSVGLSVFSRHHFSFFSFFFSKKHSNTNMVFSKVMQILSHIFILHFFLEISHHSVFLLIGLDGSSINSNKIFFVFPHDYFIFLCFCRPKSHKHTRDKKKGCKMTAGVFIYLKHLKRLSYWSLISHLCARCLRSSQTFVDIETDTLTLTKKVKTIQYEKLLFFKRKFKKIINQIMNKVWCASHITRIHFDSRLFSCSLM